MENKELDLAWKIISSTATHLFLTGKAGTGKTTFLRELRRKLPKRMVVVAPTGIAAINAEGVTIHSFFQLPFGPQIPGQRNAQNKRYAFRRGKLRLIRTIDLVVIDEISMVRADLLDAIDGVLRQYRDHYRPFGGVQMLLIGDMQQLAPVAREDEWELLKPYYDTPYFFSSKALQQSQFVTVELQHVYRQSDPTFINILNKVRTNTADDETLAKLNERFIPGFTPKKEEGYIRLTTHNAQADAINNRELEALSTPPFTYEATVKGEFPELSFPTDKSLTLKLGAQVMFVKNDTNKRYFNGMIGEIVEIEREGLKVRPSNGDDVIEVRQDTWQNMKYVLNEKTKEIEEKEVGTFVQYPLKTAWAITVHKSQGLTFEHAIIDVQHSFAHGQTYVALSRCKTLEGMVLSTPIPRYAIISDNTVDAFANDPRHQSPDNQHLDLMKRQYFFRLVEELFSFSIIRGGYEDMIHIMREFFYQKYNTQYNAWCVAYDTFKKEVEQVAVTFHHQYSGMIQSDDNYTESEIIQERIKKGSEYFADKLVNTMVLLQKTKLKTNNRDVSERLDRAYITMLNAVRVKILVLHTIANEGFAVQSYLKLKSKALLEVEKEK